MKQAKLTNKFIEIMFSCRKRVDEGATIESLNQYNSNEHNDQYSELDNSLNNSLDSNLMILYLIQTINDTMQSNNSTCRGTG